MKIAYRRGFCFSEVKVGRGRPRRRLLNLVKDDLNEKTDEPKTTPHDIKRSQKFDDDDLFDVCF